MNCNHCNLDCNKIIYKNNYWTLIFHKQDYLGRCILVLNRHIPNFNQLSNEELISFRDTLKLIENKLHKLFNCTMLNWSCNMNNAVGRGEEAHVHIHIRPRYQNKININGILYEDKEFGSHYDRFAPMQFDEKTISYIFDTIKKSFNN